jgi:hypothetical protein
MLKSLLKLKDDPRVKEIWDESNTGDGYWVNLKDGFADMEYDPFYPNHVIHEWTAAKVLSRMKDVKPCVCEECGPKKSV